MIFVEYIVNIWESTKKKLRGLRKNGVENPSSNINVFITFDRITVV